MAATSVVIFMYVLWILQGMYVNMKMRTTIERMHIVNFLNHYVKKTFLFYLVIGVTYLVLLLEQDNPDYVMLGNIFISGVFGVGLGMFWVMTYKKACADGSAIPP